MRHLRLVLSLFLAALAVIFLVLSWQNSLALKSVSIRLKEGKQEQMDHVIPGFGAEHKLPDYKVQLRVHRRLMPIGLGTRLNTSATNWLEFAVNDLLPVRHLQEIIIIEDDKIENDQLDRIQGTGLEREGTTYQTRLETTRNFEVGMNWFFSTPIGKAFVVAFILAFLGLLASIFRG